ncbi:MAG: enoyl-CoA hydratase [Syntrophales bacterium]|nr:enoyl-CoA hydratase [Syntrophales bacterium]
MIYAKLILEKKEGIAVVTMNSPENMNSITTGSMLDELIQCMDDFVDDDGVKVVVIQGAGRAFSSGGNVKSMKEGFDRGIKRSKLTVMKLGSLALKIRNLRKPVIASVRGPAAGAGCNLALACDFRIAAEDAYFLEAFVKIGLIPDLGGTALLVQSLGVPRATELLMLARPLKAREAYEWGLVNRIVPGDQLQEATMEMARTLAKGATTTYGYIKTMINRAAFSGLEASIDNEVEFQGRCYETDDFREGVTAFVEKRPPVFKGC